MNYCAIPAEVADVLCESLSDSYRDDPDVRAIVDRRAGERRSAHAGGGARRLRARRSPMPGGFSLQQPET